MIRSPRLIRLCFDSLGVVKQVVGWVLILSAVGGFYWSFKLLADAPGSLVGILLLIPVMVAAMAGVNLAGSKKEGD